MTRQGDKPGVIFCQVKGFKPAARTKRPRPRHDSQAETGPISVPGEGDRAPVRPARALARRHRRARGQCQTFWTRSAARDQDQGQGRRLQVAIRTLMTYVRCRSPAPSRAAGSPPQRQQPVQSRPGPVGPLPVQGGRPNDYAYISHQPRQYRSLAAPCESYRTRGPDRRRALRHRTGARPARGQGQ